MNIQKYFNKREPNMKIIIVILVFVSIVTLFVATGLGPISVNPATTGKILINNIPILNNYIEETWEPIEQNIIMGLRLPRVFLGLIVGASLSVCGVSMQALVRNTLADPYILGVSNGAAAFATLGILFGAFSFLGTYSLAISAFIGATITIFFVYTISRVRGRINITELLLAGVAISMIMNGLTSVIKLSAPNALGLHNAEFWMSGSLASAKWAYLRFPLIVLLFCMAFLMVNYRGLNLLLLGDESAGALGINPNKLQKQLILISSLMAGVTISVSGSIGFVGLMVPHFTRLVVGSDHKRVLPVSALLGGILVIWVDVIARMLIAPEELPVGVLTAIIGGPVFIWMLKKSNKKFE